VSRRGTIGNNDRSNTNKKEKPMSYLSIQEKIECLRNLLADPDDWISFELLRLADENETEPEASDRPVGKSDSSPEASKRSSKRR
jgi:hypothetical protein